MRVARQLDGVNPKDLLLTTLLNNKFFSMTLFNKKSYTTICFVSFFFIRFSMSILQTKSAGGDDGDSSSIRFAKTANIALAILNP